MSRTADIAGGHAETSRSDAPRMPVRHETVLALRLLALAIVSACGVFVPLVLAEPRRFIGGVVFGSLLSLVQYARSRAGRRTGTGWTVAHIAVWTYLVSVSGAQRSPVFLGYLLEVPMAGALTGGRGIAVASSLSAAAIALLPLGLHTAYHGMFVATAVAFLSLVAALTWWLIGMLGRQRIEIERAHEALRRRADSLAEELRLLGDYLNSGLLAIDSLGRIVGINRAGARLLGLESDAVEGKPWQDILAAEAVGARHLTRAIADANDARGLRLVLTGRSGRSLCVEADVWTGPSPRGTRTYVLFGPPRPFDLGASDPLRRLGEAAACVSHQIKNSLHALQGFARQISGEQASAGAATPTSGQLLRALGTLEELAEDVLAMSGAPREPEARLPLRDVVSSAVILARRGAVRIEVDAPDAPVYVRAHRGRLVHALFNLIDNACRASPPGSVVGIALWAADGRAGVDICDQGPGLALGPRAASASAHSRPGSGYGLLAARRFLESCSATLEFDAVECGGTRCRVVLERAAAGEPALAEIR